MRTVSDSQPLVGVVMGSRSDWDTMQHCSETLGALGVAHEVQVVSAHRTPDLLFEYAIAAPSRGLQVIIAGAGGAAHLPGMLAAKTHLPVLGVPVQSHALNGIDSLLSIAQMPAGIPVGTLAIGRAGAINAALFAAAILQHAHPQIGTALLAKPQLDALNDAIRAGGVLTVGGAVVSESIEAGLITTDSRLIYRIEDEIPVMLADDGIGTTQFRDFPRR